MIASSSAQRVAEAGRELGLEIDVREFPEGTRTAEDAARAIGVGVGQIVKSLVFLADGRPVLCLMAGVNRLEAARLAVTTEASQVRRAGAEEVEGATGFTIGGVPPFGHRQRLPVYCDRDLLAFETVWAAAGTPRAVFSIAPGRLVRACRATVADLRDRS